MRKPFSQSFWVCEGQLCAGCYPGALDSATRDSKLRGLLDCGVRRVLSLMEATENSYSGRSFEPYVTRLLELAEAQGVSVDCQRLSIRDGTAPLREVMSQILDTIDASLREQVPLYVHCWGGHGRTSTVIACHLIRQGSSPRQAIDTLLRWRSVLPKNHHPFEGDQEEFIRNWTGMA